MNLKDGWNASNGNRHFLPQVIIFQHRIFCFGITEHNLQALAQRQEYSAAACQFLPFGAELASPLGSQSYPKPEFIAPQNRHDGMHPDTMIRNFRALLTNTLDAMHRMAIYSGMRKGM
jgi:hypothetical protein